MDKKDAALFNAFLNAAGTIVAAIGATPTDLLPPSVKEDLGLSGNALQAAGSALQADTAAQPSGVYGNGLQAVGNSVVIYGILDDAQRAQMSGNWFQALGGAYTLKQNFAAPDRNLEQALNVTAGFMQVIGNALQGISTAFSIRKITGEKNVNQINAVGSWIQALGAFIAFLVILHDFSPFIFTSPPFPWHYQPVRKIETGPRFI